MTSGAPRVLIVDDEPAMRDLVRETLELSGFDVAAVANDGVEAVRLFDDLDTAPAVVVLDQRMPGYTGVETAKLILAREPNQMIVLFSAGLTDDVVTEALNAGVQQCVDKLSITRLAPVLHTLLGSQKWMSMRDRSTGGRTP